MNLFNLFLRSVFIDNMIFAYFLGMCSYLAVSKTVKTSAGLGLAVTFVLVVTVPVNYLINKYLLSPGALSWISPRFATIDLSFLTYILFIAIIAAIVQILEMVIETFTPSLYSALGIFLPLIAVNCAILGCSLFMQERAFGNVGERLVVGHRGHRCHPRKTALFQDSQRSARRGHLIHYHWFDGYCIYGIYGNQTINYSLPPFRIH